MAALSDEDFPSYRSAIKKGLISSAVVVVLPFIFEVGLLFTPYTLLNTLSVLYFLIGAVYFFIGGLYGWFYASPSIQRLGQKLLGIDRKLRTQKHAEVRMLSNVIIGVVCMIASFIAAHLGR